MNASRRIRVKTGEKGIALLISIFILLLISVVAIALVISSGTERAMAGNYRSSTGVYYAALAGLEEVRSRLQPKNPAYFGNTSPGFLPTPLPVGTPVYVINPLATENVAPWDPASTYPDTEYNQEFLSSSLTLPNPSPSTFSVWNSAPLNGLSFPGPLYKWVRINAVSEQSLNLLVAPYNSGSLDSTTPVFYDGSQLNISGNGSQVLEITSLAVLPNGSQKLLQYLVGPASLNISFPSAFTILSTNTIFTGSTDVNFEVEGHDQVRGGTCNPPQPTLPGIGVLNLTEVTNVKSGGNGGTGILPPNKKNYIGIGPTPSVLVFPTLPANMQTPAALDGLVQLIEQSPGTVFLPGGVDSNSLPYQMSPANPMTVVVNGDFVLTNGATGYGLLIVTGQFSYTGDSGWKGIVLVVGQGRVVGSNVGGNEFDGAVLVASTRDSAGNLLGAFGQADLDLPAASGLGIFYNSCRINDALPGVGTKILSFHEISQ